MIYDDGDIETIDLSTEIWNHTTPDKNSNVSIVKILIDSRFVKSTKQELEGLLGCGACVTRKRCEITRGAAILGPRVIHSAKTDTHGNPKYKTRLVAMGHTDPEKGLVLNEALSILRSSVRMILSLCALLGMKIWP